MSIAHANPFRYLTVIVQYRGVSSGHKAEVLAAKFRPYASWTGAALAERDRVLLTLHDGSVIDCSYDESAQYLPVHRDTFEVQLLTETAQLPTRGSEDAAGLDLYYDGPPVKFLRGERKLLSTGIALTCPVGTYARVAPRSGLSVKGFDVGAGVVDRDYTGEVKVVLTWHDPQGNRQEPDVFGTGPMLGTQRTYEIRHGERIAQLVFEKIVYADPRPVQKLGERARGSAGFGSTGS